MRLEVIREGERGWLDLVNDRHRQMANEVTIEAVAVCFVISLSPLLFSSLGA